MSLVSNQQFLNFLKSFYYKYQRVLLVVFSPQKFGTLFSIHLKEYGIVSCM